MLICLLTLLASSILASAVRAEPTLAPEVVTAATPPAGAVETFMTEATGLLQSDKAPDQEIGRNAIIKYVNPAPNQPQPTAGFTLAYAKALNSKLLPLAKHGNWRVRLNAVLATERVVAKAGSAADELAPAIKAFCGDANEAVVLWAVKASKHVAGRQPALILPALVDAVKRFPATANAAYSALDVKPPRPELVTAVQDLMEERIKLYAQSAPPDPVAEKYGILRLVDSQWWKLQNPQQQTRSAQILANLTAAVFQQITPDTPNERKDELVDVIKTIGAGMETIAIHDQSKNMLTLPGTQAKKLSAKAAPMSMIQEAVKGIFPALQSAFPGIKQPQAASNPTTQADKLNGDR